MSCDVKNGESEEDCWIFFHFVGFVIRVMDCCGVSGFW